MKKQGIKKKSDKVAAYVTIDLRLNQVQTNAANVRLMQR